MEAWKRVNISKNDYEYAVELVSACVRDYMEAHEKSMDDYVVVRVSEKADIDYEVVRRIYEEY